MNQKTVLMVTLTVLATAILVGGGTYYLLHNKADKDQKALQVQIDELNSKVATNDNTNVVVNANTNAVADVTADWQTYANTETGLTFKYPEALGLPKEEVMNQTGDRYPVVNMKSVSLIKDKQYNAYITISNLEDYKALKGDTFGKYYTNIKSVYDNKVAVDDANLLLPINDSAGIYANSQIKYFQNSDASLRGVTAFGLVAHGPAITSIDSITTLTDGIKVIRFAFSQNATAYPTYKELLYNGSCTNGDASQCLSQEQSDAFVKYVQALTESSNENVVNEYNSVYKYILGSSNLTADWKTYTDNSTFIFKYPSDWNITTSSAKATDDSNVTIVIVTIKTNTGLTFELNNPSGDLKNQIGVRGSNNLTQNLKDIVSTGGVNFTRSYGVDSYSKPNAFYFAVTPNQTNIPGNTKYVVFGGNGTVAQINTSLVAILDEMVSTFQFTK